MAARWQLDEGLAEAFGRILADTELDPALAAEALSLPVESYIAEFESPADPLAIHAVRRFLRRALAERFRDELHARYRAMDDGAPYSTDAAAMARRRLKNACLGYLALVDGGESAAEQFGRAHNMTDSMAALSALVDNGHPQATTALETFYDSWRHDMLVLDKWFTVQAISGMPDTLQRVQALCEHPDFTLSNPNRVRSLIGVFVSGNPARFHDPDGGGYRLLADKVLAIDPRNPQLAARLVSGLIKWRRYDEARQGLMKGELRRILDAGPSRDVFEIVSKGLK